MLFGCPSRQLILHNPIRDIRLTPLSGGLNINDSGNHSYNSNIRCHSRGLAAEF